MGWCDVQGDSFNRSLPGSRPDTYPAREMARNPILCTFLAVSHLEPMFAGISRPTALSADRRRQRPLGAGNGRYIRCAGGPPSEPTRHHQTSIIRLLCTETRIAETAGTSVLEATCRLPMVQLRHAPPIPSNRLALPGCQPSL